MKKIIFAIIASSSLAACATQEIKSKHSTDTVLLTSTQKEGIISSVAYASAIRWNEEYLVSVKHLEDGLAVKRCESNKLDLAFYKSPIKDGDKLPDWKPMESGENVIMEGFIDGGKNFTQLEGEVAPGRFTYLGEPKYKLAQNKVIKGMSGGPVKDKNGNIVGLIIGHTHDKVMIEGKRNERFSNRHLSVLLPYSSIEEGWAEVENKIKTGKC